MRWLDWVDERIGLRELARSLADEPVPGGARWAYVFGSGLLFLFVLQAVTGVFLALYYVPSADHAHASLAYIQKAVPAGAYLRGLHSYGASAVVILLVLHLGQVFLFAAFKGKRELIWLSGLAMLGLMLAMAFTGYLLPWDQEAYFATKVGTSIAAEIPLLGPPTQRALLGGTELTTLTLSRFYMLHAFVLPGLILLLVSFHLYAFRRAGPAGHYRAQEPVEPFDPKQFFYDLAFVALLFVILSVLA
ncbi:MAG: cytochrome b N-terminal domain-containing protein, partial [Acidobacteria bacterium]|nr:cytochrome b N-terminal domain-containing protein [Acidobacteriota bacterium]